MHWNRVVITGALVVGIGGHLGCGGGAGTQNSVSPPRIHSVDLAWNPSSSDVIGYFVYRSSQASGPYGKLTSQVQSSTTFTDTSVRAGNTYFYAVTAVDANSVESNFSNEAEAIVPSP
jgi:fibronectin type 3 domain-containing protein